MKWSKPTPQEMLVSVAVVLVILTVTFGPYFAWATWRTVSCKLVKT